MAIHDFGGLVAKVRRGSAGRGRWDLANFRGVTTRPLETAAREKVHRGGAENSSEAILIDDRHRLTTLIRGT